MAPADPLAPVLEPPPLLLPKTAMTSHARSLRGALSARSCALGLVAGALLAACGGGGSGSQIQADGPIQFPADVEPSPAGFFVDSNKGGEASEFRIEKIFWGRLVDVYDYDETTDQTRLRYRDFVVGEDVQSDGVDYLLETNPITKQETLTILHRQGTQGFKKAFQRLDDNLGAVLPKSLQPFELPPYSLVPRNAVIVVRFDDLLKHSSISNDTVRVRTGYPPATPFEARVVPDPNFGGVVNNQGVAEFRSSRIIIDFAVSEFEAQDQSPPLNVNTVGLPPSVSPFEPNVVLRIPSQLSPATGVFSLLRNFSDHEIAATGNGPVDLSQASVDVVRAMRSGGPDDVTDDPFNGFLRDVSAPRIVGSLDVLVGGPTPNPAAGPSHFIVDLSFASTVCAQRPRAGDIIELSGLFLQVDADGDAPSGNVVNDVEVEVIAGPPAAFFGGQGSYRTGFDPDDGDVPGCFLTFSPTPTSFPAAGVRPLSEIVLRFSETIDPVSVSPYDSFIVSRTDTTDPLRRRVVGRVSPSIDLTEFRFVPVLPFNHVQNTSEQYLINVLSGQDEVTGNIFGIRDLAGNPLADVPAGLSFTLLASAATDRNGGLSLAFNSDDEDGNGNPEWRGEAFLDVTRGILRPRSVTRFSFAADRQNPVPQIMTTNAAAVQEPLNNQGARLMAMWRHVDLGIDFTDEALGNIDVERVSFAPRAGSTSLEFFPQFEMSLAHSTRLPDETFDPLNGVFVFPASGFVTTSFLENVLDDPQNPLQVVHERQLGFEVNPVNDFQSAVSGSVLHPFPLNSGPNPAQFDYFTWRNTAVQAVDGADSSGIPLSIEFVAGVQFEEPIPAVGDYQAAGAINSLGLPLLMEFKCFPTGIATLSANAFDTSIANTNGTVPFFRIFSAGGANSSGMSISKNPDLQTTPTGGFSPGGAATQGFDNLLYIGQADFVVRVSRAYTIWMTTGNANPTYETPITDPIPDLQPSGTAVTLSFRGATNVINGGGGNPAQTAAILDAYGDILTATTPPQTDPALKNAGVTFGSNGFAWTDDISDIDLSQFVQVRMNFFNNTATELSPELSAIGIPFDIP